MHSVEPHAPAGIDRYGVSLRTRLLMMGGAMLTMAMAYGSLALTNNTPPLFPMAILGVAYSVVNVGYWASIPMVLQPHQLSAAAGVVGALMNVLPGTASRSYQLGLSLAPTPLSLTLSPSRSHLPPPRRRYEFAKNSLSI